MPFPLPGPGRRLVPPSSDRRIMRRLAPALRERRPPLRAIAQLGAQPVQARLGEQLLRLGLQRSLGTTVHPQ